MEISSQTYFLKIGTQTFVSIDRFFRELSSKNGGCNPMSVRPDDMLDGGTVSPMNSLTEYEYVPANRFVSKH